MLPKDVSNRLREHSGLPVATPQLGSEAFIDIVQAIRRGESGAGLTEAVADVIDCLEALNHHSQVAPGRRGEILNVDVVYAISGMTLLGLEVSMELIKTDKGGIRLLSAVWRIGCAWDALLAGDIEDIHQHLDLEAAARKVD